MPLTISSRSIREDDHTSQLFCANAENCAKYESQESTIGKGNSGNGQCTIWSFGGLCNTILVHSTLVPVIKQCPNCVLHCSLMQPATTSPLTRMIEFAQSGTKNCREEGRRNMKTKASKWCKRRLKEKEAQSEMVISTCAFDRWQHSHPYHHLKVDSASATAAQWDWTAR